MQLNFVVLCFGIGEFADAFIERGLKVGYMRLKLRELGGEGEVLLFDKRTVLLGVDIRGVSLGADGVELVEEASNVGVGPGGDGGGVAG